jgi:hypothetical protein
MPPGTSTTSEKDYFWINSVKSHCYVAFENENGAKLAREALNNTVWPQSNPKQLKVIYNYISGCAKTKRLNTVIYENIGLDSLSLEIKTRVLFIGRSLRYLL